VTGARGAFGGRPRFFGRATAKKGGGLNDTEEAYQRHLAARKQAGEIIDFMAHPMNLRLARNTYYQPDFMVIAADFAVEIHEVKGFVYEKGQMKLKVAAEMFPFRFFQARKRAKKDGGGWDIKEYAPAEPDSEADAASAP
jgi:hypothetical protein